MFENIVEAFEDANKFQYINLFPQNQNRIRNLQKLAQEFYTSNFKIQLIPNVANYEYESSYQQFSKYKYQADKFYRKIKKQKSLIKTDQQMSQLLEEVDKKVIQWEQKYNLVFKAAEIAYQRSYKLLNSYILKSSQHQRVQETRRQVSKFKCSPNKKLAKKANNYIRIYQQMKNQLSPSQDLIKNKVLRQIAANFDEAFQNQIVPNIKPSAQLSQRLEEIEQKQLNLEQFIKSLANNYQYNISEQEDKLTEFKLEIKKQYENMGNNPIKLLEFQSINKAALNQILNQMIKLNKNQCEQPKINSKYLIQPIYNSDTYYIIDLTNPIFNEQKHIAPMKFYPHCGFIHLSQSLVLAGGYNDGIFVNNVNQAFQNHDFKALPPMRYHRCNFPLVEFNDGKIIAAICGKNAFDSIRNCQIMHDFKSWVNLPSMEQKCEGVSACAVGQSKIFVLGGKPYFRSWSIALLDINRLHKKWVKIFIASEIFLERCIDSACYIKQQNKMIVFGSYKSTLTMQMSILDDMSIQVLKESQMFPFKHRQNLLMVWKTFKGSLYSFDIQGLKVWKYNDQGEWI